MRAREGEWRAAILLGKLFRAIALRNGLVAM